MIPLTKGVQDTLPVLHSIGPGPPSVPNFFILPTIPLSRHTQPTLLVDVEQKQSTKPRRQHHIDHAELTTQKEGAFGVRLTDKRLQMTQELSPRLVKRICLSIRMLHEPIERRNDLAADMIDPDPRTSLLIRIGGVQRRPVAALIRIHFVEILADYSAFIQGFLLRATALANGDSQSRHETSWIQRKELGFLLVRVDLEVLVVDVFLVQRDPCALHERAEPPAIQDQWVGGTVFLRVGCCAPGCVRVERCVDAAHFGGCR